MYVQRALEILRARGHRITQPRRAVLEALDRAGRAMSPYDLQRLLREEGRNLDHVTIYRTLELLCSQNLAHRVTSLGGFVRCSLDKEDACHRYMVCRSCGTFSEFADEALCQKEEEDVKSYGLLGEKHVAASLGLCADCRQ